MSLRIRIIIITTRTVETRREAAAQRANPNPNRIVNANPVVQYFEPDLLRVNALLRCLVLNINAQAVIHLNKQLIILRHFATSFVSIFNQII